MDHDEFTPEGIWHIRLSSRISAGGRGYGTSSAPQVACDGVLDQCEGRDSLSPLVMVTATHVGRSRGRCGGDDRDGDPGLKMLNLIRLAMREENKELKEGIDGVARATVELRGRVRVVGTEVSKITTREISSTCRVMTTGASLSWRCFGPASAEEKVEARGAFDLPLPPRHRQTLPLRQVGRLATSRMSSRSRGGAPESAVDATKRRNKLPRIPRRG